jgi:hypothetical protein
LKINQDKKSTVVTSFWLFFYLLYMIYYNNTALTFFLQNHWFNRMHTTRYVFFIVYQMLRLKHTIRVTFFCLSIALKGIHIFGPILLQFRNIRHRYMKKIIRNVAPSLSGLLSLPNGPKAHIKSRVFVLHIGLFGIIKLISRNTLSPWLISFGSG